MATLVQAQAYLTTLEGMLASGVLSTTHGDTSVTFKDNRQLLSAINYWRAEVAALSEKPRVRYAYQYSKGL